MFELEVESEFCAAHAIVIRGDREPAHGHNWRVTAIVGAASLDEDGLVCDFHEVARILEDVIAPLQNADLNSVSPFDRLNPTAEHVARHIAYSLQAGLGPDVTVKSVRVTEAPGCAATYRRPS